ncbi:Zuotin [Stygiomarasmius scandens]|uniref:Zuotin n=1 Tax=Marasmiellus scandens TaxID=2682957 RepID=A0ABR1J3L3_9AGAR
MATIRTNAIPKSYSLPQASGAKISGPSTRRLLPTGPAFISHLRLTLHHGHSFEAHDEFVEKERQRLEELQASASNGEDDLGVGDEPETDELLSLDPKEWKKHDYYAVLGLSHLRYKATPEQIKIAHRKKVLKHHPDKKVTTTTPQSTSSLLQGLNLNTNDDAFFKCIQKAHEVLTNPEKRRQYDSVDHELMEQQEDTPTAATFKSKKIDFFEAFGPVYEREARFSRKQPVPMLGDVDASKEHVEGFYDFWYNFDSWRSFEWLDKEVNEGSDNRDDKRYTEKKNKAERARRKKEDTARLRQIVDLTLGLDPRIKRIKQQEKEAREAKKAARSAPASGTVTPKKTKEQEEEEKRKKEEEEKAAKADAKKAKAAAANAAKKARRAARAAEEAAA